jgi:hypothetical protein
VERRGNCAEVALIFDFLALIPFAVRKIHELSDQIKWGSIELRRG